MPCPPTSFSTVACMALQSPVIWWSYTRPGGWGKVGSGVKGVRCKARSRLEMGGLSAETLGTETFLVSVPVRPEMKVSVSVSIS